LGSSGSSLLLLLLSLFFFEKKKRGGGGNLNSYYRDVERPGDHGTGVVIAETAEGVGYKGSGNNTSVDVQTHLLAFWRTSTLGDYSSAAEVSGILEEFYCKWKL